MKDDALRDEGKRAGSACRDVGDARHGDGK